MSYQLTKTSKKCNSLIKKLYYKTGVIRNILKFRNLLEYINLLENMSLHIIERQYSCVSNWLQHKLIMPNLIALICKLYIWAFTHFNDHENHVKKRDHILKILKDYHRDLKGSEIPLFTLKVN